MLLAQPSALSTHKESFTGVEVDNIGTEPNRSKRIHLTLASLLSLITGVGVILVGKLQFRIKVKACETCDYDVYFQQPLVQTFCMFIAMSACLVLHFLDTAYRHRHLIPRGMGRFEFIEPPSRALELRLTPWWWFALPSLADFLGTTMINMAFTITYASTVQLLRNSIILVTAVFTMLVMRRPLVVHEWLGIVVMSVGMFIAGADSLLHPETATNSSSPTLGITLTLIGTVLNAITLISEESFLKKQYCAPLRAVGWCGVTGLMWCCASSLLAHFLGFIDLKYTWFQCTQDIAVAQISLVFILSSFLFNSTGMVVTQLGSGLLKSLIYSCRGPLMWLFEITQGWQKFSLYGLLGLIGTFLGFLIYTDIVYPKAPKSSLWRQPIGCGPCTAEEMAMVEAEQHINNNNL